ncbi:MAG TPA: VanZ family protein [Anaerolineae bacterium]|jgi:undecaprenyl-diphosphatase
MRPFERRCTIDLTLLTLFNQVWIHPLLDRIMIGLTLAGFASLPVLGVILLIGRERKVGLAILVGLAISLLFTLMLQFSALRPRPEAVRLLLPTPNFPSYPSGHAAAAFSTALVVGLSYRRLRWWGLALAGAGLIAFSRVYVGHHYPSDILGGAVLGASIGAACYGLIVAQTRSTASPRPGSSNKSAPDEADQRPATGRDRPGWMWLLWPQIAIAVIVSQMAYLNILPTRVLEWPFVDKTLHFLLIGSIAFWLNLWLRGRTIKVGSWAIPLAVLIPFFLALLEEGVQFFSPVRSADLFDLLSDLAGLLFFWWLSHKIITRMRNAPS